MSKNIIYGLYDRSGELRYIGKSSSGLKRPRRHFCSYELDKDSTHKGRWIKKSLKAGNIPYIQIIQELSNHIYLNECEKYWISYFKKRGARLTNLTDGGEGTTGYKRPPFSKEWRKKMSLAKKGRSFFKGKKHSLSSKKLMSSAKMGKRGNRSKIVIDDLGNKFNSITEASKYYNVSRTSINNNVTGRSKALKCGRSFYYFKDN